MRIFVAGASGAIGRQLVPLLVAAGHQVVGTSRGQHGVERLGRQGAEGVRLDVFDRDAVHRVLAVARPEVVVHQLTALSDVDFAANARIRREGTRNLVDAAKAAGARRIVAQSISWVYSPGDAPAVESEPLDTYPVRAAMVGAVRALEETAAELDEHVVLRYGLLYGPGTWYAPGDRVAAQLRAGDLAANDAVASFVHVADAAQAALQALTWPTPATAAADSAAAATNAVNVVDDEPAPARDWLPVLAAVLDAPAPPTGTGRAGWERGASNALARDLGWRPAYPTWRTGFAHQ
jgi:nucleoside-diphosphate-sugar epimerase